MVVDDSGVEGISIILYVSFEIIQATFPFLGFTE